MDYSVYPWLILGNVFGGVGCLILGVCLLHTTKKYRFGLVSSGVRSVLELVGYSFILLGCSQAAISIRRVFSVFTYFGPFLEVASGTAFLVTSIVVLKYQRGLLDVLGAVKRNDRTIHPGRDRVDNNGHRDDSSSTP